MLFVFLFGRKLLGLHRLDAADQVEQRHAHGHAIFHLIENDVLHSIGDNG